MWKFLKARFGIVSDSHLTELLLQGANVIDVRSPPEYQAGHVPKSRNIPLGELPAKLSQLPPNKPIILCCASGVRSATAKKLLLLNGYQAVYNGRTWRNVLKHVNELA